MILVFYEHLEDLAAYVKAVGIPEIALGRWTISGQPTIMNDYPRRAVLVASLLTLAPTPVLRACLLPVWKYQTDVDGRVITPLEGENNQTVATRIESARSAIESWLKSQGLEIGRAVPSLPKDLDLTWGTTDVMTFNKETNLYESQPPRSSPAWCWTTGCRRAGWTPRSCCRLTARWSRPSAAACAASPS